jgi:hypothetical protein
VTEAIQDWFTSHPTLCGMPLWLTVSLLSIVTAAVSIGLTAIALVKIPADYFQGPEAPDWTRHRHPVIRWAIRLARNLIGWFLVIAGIIMSPTKKRIRTVRLGASYGVTSAGSYSKALMRKLDH